MWDLFGVILGMLSDFTGFLMKNVFSPGVVLTAVFTILRMLLLSALNLTTDECTPNIWINLATIHTVILPPANSRLSVFLLTFP